MKYNIDYNKGRGGIKKLESYLEYLTRDEMKKAADAGQSNLTRVEDTLGKQNIHKRTELPDWMKHDFGDLPFKIQKRLEENPELLVSELSAVIHDNDVRDVTKIRGGYIRAVISSKGKIYWCFADDAIHGNIILYMMVIGALPMNEEFGDYKWGKRADNLDVDTSNDFLCIARANADWGFAESYTDNIAHRLNEKLKTGALKQYDKAFEKLGVDKYDFSDKIFL